MRLTGSRAGRLALASVLATILAIGAFALTGATDEETMTPGDAAQMRKLVNEYWAAIHHVWPESHRGGNQKKLPDALKSSMRAKRWEATAKLTTGRLARWEEDFDPGGFLEEVRSTGTVATGDGHELLSMTEPVLVSEGLAQADVVIRGWSEQYVVDSEGKPVGDPYRTENVSTYRYTFQRVDGAWRIALQDLVSNPL